MDIEREKFEWDENKRTINLDRHGLDLMEYLSSTAAPHIPTLLRDTAKSASSPSIRWPKDFSPSYGLGENRLSD